MASEAITAGASDYIQKQPGTEQYRLLANRIQNLVDQYRSQLALKRSEDRCHNLVDTAPIPILIFDTDGGLVSANQTAVDFIEADSYADIDAEPFRTVLHPDDQSTARDRFQRLVGEKRPAPEIEYRVRTLEGEVKRATVATGYGSYSRI